MITLKSDLYDIYLSLRFELTKHMRRKRLLIVGAIAILVPLLIGYLGYYASDFYTVEILASSSLGFITLLVIIAGAMFAGDAISGEIAKKTGLLLFPTPQKRFSIIAGKYIAALTATIFVVSIYYVILTIQIIHLFGAGELSIALAKSYLIAILFAGSIVSLFYFFSSLLKGTTAPSLIGFFFILMILPIFSGILMLCDIDPWFIVTTQAGLITQVFGVSGMMGEQVQLSFGSGIAVMIVYALAFFFTGAFIASRKNME
ncbi:MAG: ABC transporter permease [Chloroflexota bacterium]|nr:ABC transporter permease [Chloroflexota bacterium]